MSLVSHLKDLRPVVLFDRRKLPDQKPAITAQETYESAIHYLTEAGELYTAALVAEALQRIERRHQQPENTR